MTEETLNSSTPSAEAVMRFLRDHPDFLIRHGLYQGATNDKVVELGQVLIQRASDVIRQFHSTRNRLEDIHFANDESMARVQQVACLLMAAASPAEVITTIRDYFPPILGVRAAVLMLPAGSDLEALAGSHRLDPGDLDALTGFSTGGRGTYLGQPRDHHCRAWAGLITPLPESVAFASLPGVLPDQPSPGVLALAGSDASSFLPDDGTDLLEFTASLIAIALMARGQG